LFLFFFFPPFSLVLLFNPFCPFTESGREWERVGGRGGGRDGDEVVRGKIEGFQRERKRTNVERERGDGK
jgi:hypothetical protein